MRLYIYRGLDDERVPKDTTHAIVDDSVIIIKYKAFQQCIHLVSITIGESVAIIDVSAFSGCTLLASVIMGDNVKNIKYNAFNKCYALRFIRLSKTLEHIGHSAFWECYSLEALFLSSTVKSIGDEAFYGCRSLRLLILPSDIHPEKKIIGDTAILQITRAAGVRNRIVFMDNVVFVSNRNVNEWLVHHMDDSPFHKLCYDPSITTRMINAYLDDNDNDSALALDTIHRMTPLHMLTMNPHAPADSIASLLDSNVEAVFRLDTQRKSPLDYARDYNVGGLVGMIAGLCVHRNSSRDVKLIARDTTLAVIIMSNIPKIPFFEGMRALTRGIRKTLGGIPLMLMSDAVQIMLPFSLGLFVCHTIASKTTIVKPR